MNKMKLLLINVNLLPIVYFISNNHIVLLFLLVFLVNGYANATKTSEVINLGGKQVYL